MFEEEQALLSYLLCLFFSQRRWYITLRHWTPYWLAWCQPSSSLLSSSLCSSSSNCAEETTGRSSAGCRIYLWWARPRHPGNAVTHRHCAVTATNHGRHSIDHMHMAAFFPLTSHWGWEAQMWPCCVVGFKSYKPYKPINFWQIVIISLLPDWLATIKTTGSLTRLHITPYFKVKQIW